MKIMVWQVFVGVTLLINLVVADLPPHDPPIPVHPPEFPHPSPQYITEIIQLEPDFIPSYVPPQQQYKKDTPKLHAPTFFRSDIPEPIRPSSTPQPPRQQPPSRVYGSNNIITLPLPPPNYDSASLSSALGNAASSKRPQTHINGQQNYVGGPNTLVRGPQIHAGGPNPHVSRSLPYVGGPNPHVSRSPPYVGGPNPHVSRPQPHFSHQQPNFSGGQQPHFDGGSQTPFGGGSQSYFSGGPQPHFSGGPQTSFRSGPQIPFRSGPQIPFRSGPQTHFNVDPHIQISGGQIPIPRTPGRGCEEGQVLHIDGRCLLPKVTRRVFVYTSPDTPQKPPPPPPKVPNPEIISNLLFIRTRESPKPLKPIVVPPPREENVVYILNKKVNLDQQVIHAPVPPPSEPEVYFLDFEDENDITLPGDINLNSAISAQNVQLDGGNAGGSLGGNIVDGGVVEVDAGGPGLGVGGPGLVLGGGGLGVGGPGGITQVVELGGIYDVGPGNYETPVYGAASGITAIVVDKRDKKSESYDVLEGVTKADGVDEDDGVDEVYKRNSDDDIDEDKE